MGEPGASHGVKTGLRMVKPLEIDGKMVGKGVETLGH